MIPDLERYRFAADSLHGVATVAILCVTCHEKSGDEAGVVTTFEYTFPSLGDVHKVIGEHETQRHGAAA